MIDLHIHTTYSDGTSSVEEILKMCEQKKLEYISITDHDTCKQYTDKAFDKLIFSGQVIKGSELHAIFQNKCIEILAYDIDINIINEWLEKYYSEEKLRECQFISRERMFEIFDKNGIIYDRNKTSMPESPTAFVEKPIYLEAMEYKENIEKFGIYAESFKNFYRKGLTTPESTFFMKQSDFKPQYKEVIDIIHKAGGKAFLAHPFEYKLDDTINFIDSLMNESRLDGIECYHPSEEEDNNIEILIDYTKKNNLFISGGSDFHGTRKKGIEVGIGKGTLKIPKNIVEEWK